MTATTRTLRVPGRTFPRLGALLSTLRLWLRVRRERETLSRLDDRMLRDIGLTRGEAIDEASRPIWDVRPL